MSSMTHIKTFAKTCPGLFLIILRIYYVQQNRRRDKRAAEGEVQNVPEDEFADKTDLELPGFRYVVSCTVQTMSRQTAC
jgi:hypothetical protein